MSTQFPHMSDRNFPGLPADNYRGQSRYDYTLWGAGTRLKLLNVNWRSDYSNVVKFENDAARDAYFDAATGYSNELNSEYRMLPDGDIKLPLPFDEVVRYNYLMIDFGKSPNPLETAEHVARYFFFIEDCAFAANNTTELHLSLDAWTTYVNRTGISYMMLERGHAPVAATDAAEYLKNPIANNRLLLSDDYNFGDPAVTRRADFVPFGNGVKFVLIATTIPWDFLDAEALGMISTQTSAGPGYHSAGDRSGYMADVTALSYAAGGRDYGQISLKTETAQVSGGSIPNNLSVFAVRAGDCYGDGGFFGIVAERFPQLLESVQGVYIVDASMLVLGEKRVLFRERSRRCAWAQAASSGKTWAELAENTYRYVDANSTEVFLGAQGAEYVIYKVEPANGGIRDITLTVDDFGYPDEYKGLAKLYTSPYAHLEVEAEDGAKAEIRVEDTGALKLWQRVSLAAPYMRYEAYLSGVGSGDSVTYEWRDVRGTAHNEVLPAGDFRDALFGYDIPAYSLYMSGYDKYRLHNYNANNHIPERADEAAYKNAVRGANTAYENARDSINKAYSNSSLSIEANLHNTKRSAEAALLNAYASNATAEGNADRSAENTADTGRASASQSRAATVLSAATAYTNTEESADTANTNTKASAATAYDNAERSADNANTTTRASADTGYETAAASAETSKANADRSTEIDKANATNSVNTGRDNVDRNVTAESTQVANENEKASYNTWLGTELQVALREWDVGLMKQQTDIQNVSNAVSTLSNIAGSGVGTLLSAASEANPTKAAATLVGGVASAAVQGVSMMVGVVENQALTDAMIDNSGHKLAETNTNTNDLKDSNINTANKNLAVHVANVKAVADANKDTSIANITNSYNGALASNQATYDVTISNAGKSRDTAKSNAALTYAATVKNAQATKNTSVSNAANTRAATVSNAARSRSTAETNAGNAYNTSVSNIEKNRDTSETNAANTRETGDANALRTYNAAIGNLDEGTAKDRANAVRDRDVALANAVYTRDNAVAAAQRNLEVSATNARAGYHDRKLDPAVAIGAASGDPVPDEMRWRGVSIRVKTQRDGEIAQAGDMFRRYGYALNQMWRFAGYNLMRHFTYWKCSDVWVTSSEGVIESARRTIESALRNGVTVWNNPDEIGKVSIYEND